MQWDDSLSVKIGEIDAQHKKLLSMINEFSDNLRAAKKEAIGALLDGLANYTIQHFALEERYFDEFGYENAEAHKKEHSCFVGKIADVKKRYESGEMAMSLEITFFLMSWLVSHIKGTDRKYAGCFHDNGLK